MKKILTGLFFVSLLMRLYFLFFGFNSITNDEADYYLSSYLFAKSGTDQYGNQVFFSSGFMNAISSVPVYIGSLFWTLIPIKSVFVARLPFALLNSITPVLFFSIVYYFSRNKTLSLVSFAIMNFSPWFLHLSSTAGFDSPLSLLFFLSAVNVLCYVRKPIWIRWVSFTFFSFLAFNSYMGFKTIFPFLVFLFLTLDTLSQKKSSLNIKSIFTISIITVTLFITFFIIAFKGPGGNLFSGRASKTIVFLEKSIIENEVWYANLTTNNKVVRKLFNNVIISPLQMFLSKYANALNPALFFFGDPHVIYGLRIMGLFFVSDIFLFFVGIFFGFQKLNREMKIFVLGLLFIAPLPAALQIEGLTVALRGMFLLPAISLLIACGYIFLIQKINKRVFLFFISSLFIINVVSFLGLYQARIKIVSAESWGGSQKLILEDVNKLKPNKIQLHVNDEKVMFMKYGIYNPIQNLELFKQQLMNSSLKQYTDGNVKIHFSCAEILSSEKEGYYVFEVKKCPNEYKKMQFHFKTLKKYYSLDKSGDLLYILTKRI